MEQKKKKASQCFRVAFGSPMARRDTWSRTHVAKREEACYYTASGIFFFSLLLARAVARCMVSTDMYKIAGDFFSFFFFFSLLSHIVGWKGISWDKLVG